MSATTDYYKILRVDPEAEREVIRAAYVSSPSSIIPTRGCGGANGRPERGAAVLGDSARRAAYDRARRTTPVTQPARAARSHPSGSGTVYTPSRGGAATGSYTTRDFERYSG